MSELVFALRNSSYNSTRDNANMYEVWEYLRNVEARLIQLVF